MSDSGKTFARVARVTARGADRPGLTSSPWALCLLTIVLAGCAVGPPRNADQVPDWEREDVAPAPTTPVIPEAPPAPVPAPPPPAAVTNQPAETWIPLNRWCQAKGLAEPCLVTLAALPAYTLNTPNGVFVFRLGSQSARWDGLDIRLGFAPQVVNGQPFLHALDLKKTVEPLATGAFMSCLESNRTIVIDPGHGGTDSGATSVLGYGYEKHFTLDWAMRLGALLTANGWRVFLTRTNDMDLSLSSRIAFAAACKADLFLSLHFNSAAPNDREEGLETYCLTPTGMASSVTRGFGDDPALAFPNNAFDEQNLHLALRVHRALLQVNGRLDRGIRRARYLGVLRGQNRPAILVEGGYLSSPREARRLSDPAYRQKLAEAVAQALALNTGAGNGAAASASQRSEAGEQSPQVQPTNGSSR